MCSRSKPLTGLSLPFLVTDRSSPGGHANDGGASSAVQDQLRKVQQIQASYRSFAAILGDGC